MMKSFHMTALVPLKSGDLAHLLGAGAREVEESEEGLN